LIKVEIRTERTSIGSKGFCGCTNGEVEETYLDFEEFFNMMKDRILSERHNTQNIEFESTSSNVSCLLWI